jgi:hypothetical protein
LRVSVNTSAGEVSVGRLATRTQFKTSHTLSFELMGLKFKGRLE